MKPTTSEVFGISQELSEYTYVDRGNLDSEIQTQLGRETHVSIRGESKVGKSWLRQRVIPNALPVQCGLKKTVLDVYSDALSQLGVRLERETRGGTSTALSVSAQTEIGHGLLARLGLTAKAVTGNTNETVSVPIGNQLEVLSFVAKVLRESKRRLVIEDFHYLSTEQRRLFAYDLKSLWDMGVYVGLVGIWGKSNLLLHLNTDLTGRVYEFSISWTKPDLDKVIARGEEALNLSFSSQIRARLVDDSYGNVGTLQQAALLTLDEARISERSRFSKQQVNDISLYESAAMKYAAQLEAAYIQFAERVSRGIRRRPNGTGIYAHALAAVLELPDQRLMEGIHVDEIHEIASSREPRIQKGNLKTALGKIEGLQVDEEGRGLILSYDDYRQRVTVADKQLLFFRKYMTIPWPWRDLIEWADQRPAPYSIDEDD